MEINKQSLVQTITPYVFGTTRLGDDSIPEEQRIELARKAMESGVWFHTSRQYNSALSILRKAFDQDRSSIPALIVKLGGNTIEEFREDIRKNTAPLGISTIDVGQLCLGGSLAEEIASGGAVYRELEKIREEGLVRSFVMEVFPWTSDVPYRALKAGYSDELVDAHIFYLNPLQRFVSNTLWSLLQEKKKSIIAMRTVSGGPVHSLRDVPGFAWKKYLQERAVEVAPLFEQSGEKSWTRFCVRFAHSLPGVLATVGATSRDENLDEFLKASNSLEPLPDELLGEISRLHHRWSDETDILAEPWSM